MTGYNTNLAAEFYILSMLHRLGADATLTLGNKKGVDIVVVRDSGDAVTIDVKGVAKRYDWPAGNAQSPRPERHFIVLVSFEESPWAGSTEPKTQPAELVHGALDLRRSKLMAGGS